MVNLTVFSISMAGIFDGLGTIKSITGSSSRTITAIVQQRSGMRPLKSWLMTNIGKFLISFWMMSELHMLAEFNEEQMLAEMDEQRLTEIIGYAKAH